MENIKNTFLNNKKLILILTATIIIIFIVSTIIIVRVNSKDITQPKEEHTVVNNSYQLSKEKTFEGLRLSNIKLSQKGKECTLTADVTNATKKDIDDFTFLKITFLDKTGKTIGTAPGMINPIKAGKKTGLSSTITSNYVEAYDFKIEIDKER